MRRSPQEKERQSYLKDGRNVYGENDKASRKNLPKTKKLVNPAYRKKANSSIQQAERASDPDFEVLVEPRLKPPGPPAIKYPDQRLGEYVANRLDRRLRKGTV